MILMICLFAVGGLIIGFGLSHFLTRLYSQRILSVAQTEANELLAEVKAESDATIEEIKSKIADYEEELREKFEKETAPLSQKNRENEELLAEKEQDMRAEFQRRESQWQKRRDQLLNVERKNAELENRLRSRQQTMRGVFESYRDRLLSIVGGAQDELRASLRSRLESEHQVRITKAMQIVEEEFQLEAERTAKYVIRLVIDRFARPYCAERGIGNVEFPNRDIMDRTFGPNGQWLKKLEAECGVDIAVHDEYLSASTLGFDPVRRELGRASLERLSREKKPNDARVVEIVNQTKRDLYRKIRQDGNRIAQELRLSDLSPEVRNMMGALRYRYSFAQNQYFHCGEVGFLCGLLSSELKLPVVDGRRAGMLHDIGKAMDHSIDGGHAVIGADFIQKNGEAPHIVHAVRAHHHDEPPSTDLAFLVIAADAISGARPGARRSTMDSYTQKMADLEKIGSSFEGVIGVYIMSAGREVRVVVDSHRIDDIRALQLSKAIAKKIEEECSYPGLIKVTVVRETQAVDYAK